MADMDMDEHFWKDLLDPVLGISSSSIERLCSTYDFIHSKRRNRLDPIRAKKLVAIFTNRQLKRRAERDALMAMEMLEEIDLIIIDEEEGNNDDLELDT